MYGMHAPPLGKWLYPKNERVATCDSFWAGGSHYYFLEPRFGQQASLPSLMVSGWCAQCVVFRMRHKKQQPRSRLLQVCAHVKLSWQNSEEIPPTLGINL